MAISLRKRKDGSTGFQVRVKDPAGSWYPTPTFDDELEAKRFENELLEKKRKGARTFGSDGRRYSYNEYYEVWGAMNRVDLSEGWKLSQDQMNRDYVAPVIGRMKMTEIGQPEIGRIFVRMKDKGLSEQMRKHVYSLVRQSFGDAVEYYEMIGKNPVNPKFHRPKVKQKERDFLTPEQAFRLLEHVRGGNGERTAARYLARPVWIQILAGLRVEAIQGLVWGAIQWERDQILVCRAWKRKEGRMADYPKGKDWQYVPLTPPLREFLEAEREKYRPDQMDFVCPGPNGGMLSYDTYVRALASLCVRAGVPEMTTHELRHSTSEIFMRAGANQEDLRRLFGHADSSTTLRYMHRTDNRLQAISGEIAKPMLRVIRGNEEIPQNVSQLGNLDRMDAEILSEGSRVN